MTYQNCRARSADPACWQSNDLLSYAAVRPNLLKPLWRNPLLLSAFLLTGLLVAFQLGVTLLHPSWADPVTDWLRASLAWLGLLVSALISLRLTHARRQESRVWWMISAGLLTYAIAQTVWVVCDQFFFPNGVPVPWWPDLFFLLQYPCFFLALALLPGIPPWDQSVMSRVKMVLDCLLMIVAVTALSWYFLLAPLYLRSGQPLLGKITNLAYPVGDLGVLFGLILALFWRRRMERPVLSLLVLALICLAAADSWFTFVDLHTVYVSGGPPDVFWMACYLLFPLAGLWQLRLVQIEGAKKREGKLEESVRESALECQVIGSFRFLFPFVAALLTGGAIVIRATLAPIGSTNPLVPFGVAFGLLLLMTIRQEITFLESERWRREREVARAKELLAMQEVNQHMDTFLGMAGHELKTPLTGLKLSLQLAERRSQPLAQRGPEIASAVAPFLESLARAQRQTERQDRLVNDLLDVSRVRAGKLDLHLDVADLAVILREAVEEQCQAAPDRTLILRFPADRSVLVTADAERIGQAVTNYLSNALKYSPADRPVEAGLDVDDRQARVWVRDEGPGLPVEERERIWERFHRVKGIEIQSGSGVGLGMGLHICQTIIDRHQGQVGVESTPDKGSTFWFTLPR